MEVYLLLYNVRGSRDESHDPEQVPYENTNTYLIFTYKIPDISD